MTVLGILLSGSLAFCYAGVFTSLADQWRSNDMYSYGFLVPWISLYLVWSHRRKLLQIQPVPKYLFGFIVLISGMSALLIGHIGGILVLQELSLIVTITGLVLFLLGVRFLKALWFPITYLLFMIPIWDVITNRLHPIFQNLSASTAVMLMHSIRVPAYHSGVFIELPNITLEVAVVCSGVNYLIAVLGIGIPLAMLFLNSWKRRIFLVGFAVGISALANSVRVALIGAFSYYEIGGENLHGPFHILQGLSISIVGYGMLFVGLWVLAKEQQGSHVATEARGIDRFARHHPSKSREIQFIGLFLIMIFLLVGFTIQSYKLSPVHLEMDLNAFPLMIGKWRGSGNMTADPLYENPGVDHEYFGMYYDGSGRPVRLYVGYYESQRQGKELISYKSQGLSNDGSTVMIDLEDLDSVKINQIFQQNGRKNAVVLFWYDLNGRIVSNPYLAKFYTTWDGMIRGQTNGSIVMVTAEFDNPADQETAIQTAREFVRILIPHLQKFLPGY